MTLIAGPVTLRLTQEEWLALDVLASGVPIDRFVRDLVRKALAGRDVRLVEDLNDEVDW